jgi:catechol 2,3-dioxygenase-like lactoylglutathione lyase family enzyme
MMPDRRAVLIGSALAPAVVAGVAVGQAPPSTGQLVRCALFVSDLEASTAFYRDGIGLPELLFEGALQGAPLERLLGLAEGAGVRFRILKAEGPPYGMIALFQVTGQALTRVEKTQGSVNIGEGVLVFHRPDLDALAARLATLGHAFLGAPERLVDTPQRRTDLEVMLRDPDGVLINVIERA